MREVEQRVFGVLLLPVALKHLRSSIFNCWVISQICSIQNVFQPILDVVLLLQRVCRVFGCLLSEAFQVCSAGRFKVASVLRLCCEGGKTNDPKKGTLRCFRCTSQRTDAAARQDTKQPETRKRNEDGEEGQIEKATS